MLRPLLLLLALGQPPPLALSPTDAAANQSALQAALDAGWCAVPPGTWPHAKPLVIERAGTVLRGAGPNHSALRMTTNGHQLVVGLRRPPLEPADRAETTGLTDGSAGRRWGFRSGPAKPPQQWMPKPTTRRVGWECTPADSGRIDWYAGESALCVCLLFQQNDAAPGRYATLAGCGAWDLAQIAGDEVWLTLHLSVGVVIAKIACPAKPGVPRRLVAQANLTAGTVAAWVDGQRVMVKLLQPLPPGAKFRMPRWVPFVLAGSENYGTASDEPYPGNDTTFAGVRVLTAAPFDDSTPAGVPLARKDGKPITDAGLLFDTAEPGVLFALPFDQPDGPNDRFVRLVGRPAEGWGPETHWGILADPTVHTVDAPGWVNNVEIGNLGLAGRGLGYGSKIGLWRLTESHVHDVRDYDVSNRGITCLFGAGSLYGLTFDRDELAGADCAIYARALSGSIFRDTLVSGVGRMIARADGGNLDFDRLRFKGYVARGDATAAVPERTHLFKITGGDFRLGRAEIDLESGSFGTVAGIEATHATPEGRRGAFVAIDDGCAFTGGLAPGSPLVLLQDTPKADTTKPGTFHLGRIEHRTTTAGPMISGPVVRVAGKAWRGEVEPVPALANGVKLIEDWGGTREVRSAPLGAKPAATKPPAPPKPPPPAPPPSPPPTARPKVGMNVAPAVYYGTGWRFKDLMRSCDDWTTGSDVTDPDKAGVTWRPDGWPQGLTKTQSIRAPFGALNLPAGKYRVRARGTGRIKFEFFLGADGKAITDLRYPEWALTGGVLDGVIDLPLPVVGSPSIYLMESDPADPVHGLEVMLPGFAPGDPDPWHPALVADLAALDGPIRAMDLLAVIESPLREWADRTPPEFFTASTRRGVPYEWLADLARQAGRDLWICLPYRASADYHAKLGALLRAKLPAGSRIFVEYGNENWNLQFGGQWAFFRDRGRELHPDWSTDEYRQGRAAAGRLARLAHDAFLAGWGADGAGRVVRVLGAQQGGGRDELAEYLLAPGGAPPYLSVNAYIDANAMDLCPDPAHDTTAILALGVDGVLDAMSPGGAFLDRIVADLAKSRALAAEFGCPGLWCYEGGPHSVGVYAAQGNPELNALFDAVSADPRMAGVVQGWLAAINPHVAGVCWYHDCGADSQFGRWGARRYQLQPTADAPKRRGLEPAAAAAQGR